MISIIIPTKNEPYINELIKDVHKKVSQPHEIIVVDKSSKKPEITGAKLILQESSGLGNAVLEGIAEAKGEYIVMMDGDGSHDPVYIGEMYKEAKKYSIVVGSKYMSGGRTEDQGRRVIISKAFNFVITGFLGIKVKDIMSGYAMFNKKIFGGLILKPKGFKLLMEIVYKSKQPVKEIPVIFYKRKAGKSKVGYNMSGVKEAWRIFSLAWSLRLKTG